MRICKVCNGYGYRYRQYGQRDHQARKQDCEYCGGTGKTESMEAGFPPQIPLSEPDLSPAVDASK